MSTQVVYTFFHDTKNLSEVDIFQNFNLILVIILLLHIFIEQIGNNHSGLFIDQFLDHITETRDNSKMLMQCQDCNFPFYIFSLIQIDHYIFFYNLQFLEKLFFRIFFNLLIIFHSFIKYYEIRKLKRFYFSLILNVYMFRHTK
jgi:hypothetical protein